MFKVCYVNWIIPTIAKTIDTSICVIVIFLSSFMYEIYQFLFCDAHVKHYRMVYKWWAKLNCKTGYFELSKQRIIHICIQLLSSGGVVSRYLRRHMYLNEEVLIFPPRCRYCLHGASQHCCSIRIHVNCAVFKWLFISVNK